MSSSNPPPTSGSLDFLPLIDAARAGDSRALQSLVEHFYPTVSRMVHRSMAADLRLKKPWIASLFSTGDVVQEVFQSVLRSLESVESTSEEAFVGYLAMLVRNRLIDSVRFHEAARRDGRRVGVLEARPEPVSAQHGPATQACSAEELGLFRTALQSFAPRERHLLRERIEGGAPFQVLADRLGYASADSARKAFYVAQARLLLALQRDGLSSPDATR